MKGKSFRKVNAADLLAVSGISVRKMKLVDFDSNEDADDINVISIKTTHMDMGCDWYEIRILCSGG